jgi:fanconi-associated nuclease 1
MVKTSVWKHLHCRSTRDMDIKGMFFQTLRVRPCLMTNRFHCESRIVTTLFGLLFWDILFADVPGALETPWQSAPMDIAEDSFFFARREMIERRLSEIEAGAGPAVLSRFDDQHREHGTLCVGVQWDLFEKRDLVEIADVSSCYGLCVTSLNLPPFDGGLQCIGGRALSVICRLLAEDYASRTSGVPDLVVWDAGKRECRFVEVKGPGDTERENQKVNPCARFCGVVDRWV